MKKFVKIIIPIFIIALCAAAAVHFGVFDKEQETTTAESAVSTEKKSKYQSYIDKNSDFVGYIKIDGALSYTDALYRVSKGYDVFTYNGTFAYWLARSAGGGKIPVGPEIDKGKVGTVGYYWHYHIYDRQNEAHIFYLI